MSWGLQEQMREEGIVFGLFWNSSADLDLRDTMACFRRQFGFMTGGDFSKDYFQDIDNIGMRNYSKLKDKPGIQMDMIFVMLHNVTACYMYVYMMYMELLSFQAVKRPVIENDSIKSIPDSEPEAGSPVVCQDEVWEQHSMTNVSEDRGVSMQQTADIEDEELKNISPNDLIRTVLKWFNGAGNIPFHICRVNCIEQYHTSAKGTSVIRLNTANETDTNPWNIMPSGKVTYLHYTAMLHSRIPNLYHAIVRPKSLSTEDLNNLFILFMPRFRGHKFFDNSLKKIGHGHTELKCCGSGLADVGVKKKCIVKDNYKIDQTKDKEEDNTRHGKFDQERVGGRVNATCMNKAFYRTKPGDVLSPSIATRNAVSFMRLVCVMLFLLLRVVPTKQNPIRDKGTDSAVFHNFPLLQSWDWCPNPEKNTECPDKDRTFETKTDSCGYKCRSWEDVKCMDSKYGAVYFCVLNTTTCAKGVGWQIEGVEQNVDDPSESNVVVKESVCAEGFYQAVPSKCLNACRTRHETLALIPEGFKMASKGDHTHPTTLMCDYPAGYYNAHNKSIVNFDRSISLHYGFCTHINVSNPCSAGQMPLYNGTCVDLCGQGFKRDETDFKCREISGHLDTTGKHTTSRQPSPSRPTETSKTTTQRNKGHDGGIDKNGGVNQKPEHSDYTWYFVGGFIVVGIAIILLVGMYTKMTCCSRNSQDPAHAYPSVFYSCTDQSGSNRSSASCIGGQSSIDDSTSGAKDNPSTSNGYQKVKRSPSSDSFKDDESTIDGSLPDVDPAFTQTVAEKESLLRSPSLAGSTPNTVVKKKKVYLGNITIKIGNVGVINFGSYGENVQDMIKDLCEGLQMPLSDVVKVESSENDLGENGTDTVEEIAGKETEQIKETEHTGTEEKRIAGEEFAKPNNNTMTQLVVNGFAEFMKSVGALIYNGEVIGTVFRAGDNYVITAFHVIKRIIDPNQIEENDFTRLEASDVFLNFNGTVCESPCFEYSVRHKFSSDNGRLDFTVLQITSSVALPQKMKLDRHNHDRLQVKSLSGIGYGDPVNSFCKVLDPICPIITSVSSRVLECEQWLYADDNKNFNYYQGHVAANLDIVSKGYKGIDRVQNIFLDISMKHKGSGSPFMTNDGKVIGLLTHGHPEFYFHLPAIIQSGFPQDKRFEAVLKLEYVYAHIFERDPDLAKNLFGEV